VIVIGSGMGGLSCAAVLARLGNVSSLMPVAADSGTVDRSQGFGAGAT
jgi:2-polyprenyl-6-methoxyphenol hydroxylase-like FAD-dependent oxidoreductase